MRFEDVLFWILTALTVLVVVAGVSLSSSASADQEVQIEENQSVQDVYSVTVKVLPEDQIPENATCYPVEGEYMVFCDDGKLYVD